MDNVGKIIGDMKILKKLGYKNNQRVYEVECMICGYRREVTINNLRRAGNKHNIDTCKEGYYIHKYKDKTFGDYKVVNVSKGSITLKCTVCRAQYDFREYDIRDRYHNPRQCGISFYKNMIGDVIGDFTVIDYVGKNKHGVHYLKIKCNICEREREVTYRRLIEGKISHHNCVDLIEKDEYFYILKQRYHDIIQRTRNPNHSKFEYYGGRGITCEYESFIDFYDDLYESFVVACKEYGIRNVSLDRIDNDKGYQNGNVRWTTKLVQQTNTRRKRYFIATKGDQVVLSNNPMEFGRRFNVNGRSVGNCLRGTSNSAGGWIFEEITEEEAYKLMKEESVTTNLIIS